jgi:hypothetical protein
MEGSESRLFWRERCGSSEQLLKSGHKTTRIRTLVVCARGEVCPSSGCTLGILSPLVVCTYRYQRLEESALLLFALTCLGKSIILLSTAESIERVCTVGVEVVDCRIS